MSGTSMDGVDAALVAMDAEADSPQVDVREFVSVEYPEELRTALADRRFGHRCERRRRGHASHQRCGRVRGGGVRGLPAAPVLSTSHPSTSSGRTVRPSPTRRRFRAAARPLPARCNWPAGHDCGSDRCHDGGGLPRRRRSAGGQGAPLAPVADFLLRRSPTEGRVILNIGGIANLTWLAPGGRRDDVLAFDTGPGNMVVDELFRVLFPGQGPYDEDGAHAAAGRRVRRSAR